jgi:hypothetical protein
MMPPMIPLMMPAKGGAPLATAIPRQRGSATRKTTMPARRSALRDFFIEFMTGILWYEYRLFGFLGQVFEEIDFSVIYIIHCSNDTYLSFGKHFFDDIAAGNDFLQAVFNVGVCNGIWEKPGIIMLKHGLGDGRFDFLKELGYVAVFHTFLRTVDGAAFGVAQYHQQFGAYVFDGIFQTGQDIVVDNIACNPDAEEVAESLIKNQFHGCAGVHTAQYDSKWILFVPGFIDHFKVVVVGAQVVNKALVSFYKDVIAFRWGQVTEVFFGMFSHLSI